MLTCKRLTHCFVGTALCLSPAACGDVPQPAQPVPIEATTPTPSVALAAAHVQAHHLRRKPPTLASTIYDVDCTTDKDCTLVPQGDVCQCESWGAMRADNEAKFLGRRQRLGARCANGMAPDCTADPQLHEARCLNRQCVAQAPRALSCIDAVVPDALPVHLTLGKMATKAQSPAMSACPGSTTLVAGDTEVYLLRPGQQGKYRIVLTDHDPKTNRPHALIVRTPDCLADNVACRLCNDTSERCLVDEVLGADDTAVILVSNCDGHCTLSIDQWDPAAPLVPPL